MQRRKKIKIRVYIQPEAKGEDVELTALRGKISGDTRFIVIPDISKADIGIAQDLVVIKDEMRGKGPQLYAMSFNSSWDTGGFYPPDDVIHVDPNVETGEKSLDTLVEKYEALPLA